MPLPWRDVIEKPEYKALPIEEKRNAQLEYFNDVVAPNVDDGERQSALREFTSAYPIHAKQEGISRDIATEAGALVSSAQSAAGSGLQRLGAGAAAVMGGVASGLGREDVASELQQGGQHLLEASQQSNVPADLQGSGAAKTGEFLGGAAGGLVSAPVQPITKAMEVAATPQGSTAQDIKAAGAAVPASLIQMYAPELGGGGGSVVGGALAKKFGLEGALKTAAVLGGKVAGGAAASAAAAPASHAIQNAGLPVGQEEPLAPTLADVAQGAGFGLLSRNIPREAAHVGDLVHATAKTAGVSDALAAVLKQNAETSASGMKNVRSRKLSEHIDDAVDGIKDADLHLLSPKYAQMRAAGQPEAEAKGALQGALRAKAKQWELTPEQVQPPGADVLDDEAPPAAPADPAAARLAELDQQIKAEPNKHVKAVLTKERTDLAADMERRQGAEKLRQMAIAAKNAGNNEAALRYGTEADKLAPGEKVSVSGEPAAEPAQKLPTTGIEVGEPAGEHVDVTAPPEGDVLDDNVDLHGEPAPTTEGIESAETEPEEVTPATPPPPPVAEPIKGVDATGDVPLGGGKLSNGDTAIDQGIPRHIWVPEVGKWADAHAEIHAHENGEIGQKKPGDGDHVDEKGYGEAHDRFGNHATRTELTRQGFDTPEKQAAYARALQPYLDEAKARAERGEAFDIHPKLDKRVYEQSGLSLTKYRQKAARTSANIGKQGVDQLRAKAKADVQHSNAAEPVAGGAVPSEHPVQSEGPKEEGAGTVRPEPGQKEGEVANAAQEGVKPGNSEQQHQGTGEQRPAAEAGGGNRAEPSAPKRGEEKPGTASAARDVSKMSDDKPRGELEAEVRARQDAARDPDGQVREPAPETGHAPGHIRDALSKWIGEKAVAKLERSGLLNIVRDYADLPAHLRDWAARTGGVRAFYDPVSKKGYIIANRMPADEAAGALRHEIGIHHGARGILGEEGFQKMLNDLSALKEGGSKEASEAWQYVRDNYKHDENSHRFKEEVAAHLVEKHPELSFVKRLFTAVRTGLYKLGFTKGLNEDVVRNIAMQALRKEIGKEPIALGEPMAQRVAEPMAQRTTGIAHKYAEQRGTEAERGEYDYAGRMDEARKWLQAGNDPNSIFTDTSAKLDDRIARGRAHDDVLVAKANAAFDKHGEDSPQFKAADQAERAWLEKMKPLQTESGSAMYMQQGASEPDVGSYRGITKAISDVTGKEPTEAQKTKAKDVAGKVKAATDDLDEARNKAFDEGTGAAAPDAEFTDLSNKVKAGENTVANAAKLIRNRKRAGRAPDEIAEDVAGAGVDADTMEQGWQRVRQKLPELGLPDAKPEKLIADAAAKRDAAIKAHPPGEAWTPEHAAALWKAAKEQLGKGTKDFDLITKALSDQYGMSYEDVANGLASNKTMRKMTDELYLKQAEQRHIVNAAKKWVEEQKHPIMAGVFRVPNLFFNLATFGHGTVWPITHAAPMIFYPPAWPALAHTWKESLKMLYHGFKDGSGYHEYLMGRMKADPLWARGRRYGLDNDPSSHSEYQNTDQVRLFKRIGLAGNEAFDALKLFRQLRFNAEWENLPEEMKTDEAGRRLADMINHATGSTRGGAFVSHPATRALLFAPKLVKSQFQYLYTDTGKATYNVFKGETPEARYMAKKELRQKLCTIGTAFSLLALNQEFLSASGSDQKVNFGDPSKADWLEFKAGGMRIPIGGALMSNVRMVADLLTIPWLASKEVDGESPYHAAGKRLEDYARGKASPMMQKVVDAYDKADYSRRPLPWSDKEVPAYLQREGVDRYTYPEYLKENFTPIPVEDFFKEIARSQGASDDQSADWLGALGVAGLVFFTGIHPLPDIKE